MRLSLPTGTGPGTSTVQYKTALRLRCQVEMGTFQKVVEFFSGNSPDVRLVLIMHFRDLERAGMVDLNGSGVVRIGDRLNGIYDLRGNLVQRMTIPLYTVQADPTSFGLGLSRNLLAVFFESRAKAVNP